MKSVIALVIVSLFAVSTAAAQKRKQPTSRARSTSNQPSGGAVNKPRIIGSRVVIITKNGDRIEGELLDLTAYSARIRANSLESTIALDTVASLALSGAPAPSAQSEQAAGPVRPEFARDAEAALRFFQSLAANLKPGVDYTEYGRQLTELRRASERFITRYSATDNGSEARVVSLMAGALTDYTWVRSIWTLKFGRSSDGTIAETDSPIVTDTLALYPDLRTSSAEGARLSAEKLIGGVWRKAAEKMDRARTLVAQQK
ncbi:MAG TPA: hypothetical protein VN743_11125 [Blastocatellia bacterium]|nr:hypothetical protein [Blastocatellia bacterium]